MDKPKKFAFRCLAYQETDGSFTGVCLDLDIVEERHAAIEEAMLSINDAILSHLLTAVDLGFPKELINRSAPKKYWDKLKRLAVRQPTSQDLLPFRFFPISFPELKLNYLESMYA